MAIALGSKRSTWSSNIRRQMAVKSKIKKYLMRRMPMQEKRMSLEKEFRTELLKHCDNIYRKCGHRPLALRSLIHKKGAVKAVTRILARQTASPMFFMLCNGGKKELTLEAFVLNNFRKSFPPHVVKNCEARLALQPPDKGQA